MRASLQLLFRHPSRAFIRGLQYAGLGLASLFSCSPVQADTVDLIATSDSRIGSLNLDGNEGSLFSLAVYNDGGGNVQRSLVKFNLAQVPAGAQINSATLRFVQRDIGSSGHPTYLFRTTRDWEEMQVNWTVAKSGTPWSALGGDYTGPGGAPYATAYESAGVLVMDATALVKEWLAGTHPNYGFFLTAPAGNGLHMHSRETSTGSDAYRPQLHIDYSLPRVIFVRQDGNDGNDGLSWATAKKNIQAACVMAQPGESIWVAGGTYLEHIWVPPGAAIYGGFAGNESSVAQRTIATSPTVIDGGGTGVGVAISWGGGRMTVDGLTVTNCAMGISGGGPGSNVTVANCTVTNNHAGAHDNVWSAGIQIQDTASATVLNNVITNNTYASSNGGMSALFIPNWGGANGMLTVRGNIIAGNRNSTGGTAMITGMRILDVQDNTFTDNQNTSGSYSAGLFIPGWPGRGESAVVVNNTFSGGSNQSNWAGALLVENFNSAIISDNDVAGYTEAGGQAAIVLSFLGEVTAERNTVLGNRGTQVGGIYAHDCPILTLNENVLEDNVGNGGFCAGGLVIDANAPAGKMVLTGNIIKGNRSQDNAGHGGLRISGPGRLEFVHNTVKDNIGIMRGGAAFYGVSDFIMTGNTFENNEAGRDGCHGGVLINSNELSGSITVSENTFRNNRCAFPGGTGAMGLETRVPVSFVGNLVENNVGGQTGGLASHFSANQILANRFIGNRSQGSATQAAVTVFPDGSGVAFANNLVVKNVGPEFVPGVADPGMAVYFGGNGAVVNNTFADNQTRALVIDSNGTHPVTNNWFAYNLYFAIEYWGDWNLNPGLVDYNHFWANGWGTWSIPQVSRGVHNYTSAPAFVNRAVNDYSLQPGSGGINGGINTAVVGTMDAAGNPRIQQGTVDGGCYESGLVPNTVKPVMDWSVSPAPTVHGWNNTDATASVTATDDQNAVLLIGFLDANGNPYVNYTLFEVPNAGMPTRNFLITAEGTATGTLSSIDTDGNRADPVTVTVRIDKTAPTIGSQNVSVNEDSPLSVSVSASDERSGIDENSYVASMPAHGAVNGTGPNFTYTPAANYFGPDSFTVTVKDKAGNSATATISITVNPVNDAPVADPLTVFTDRNIPVSINLTGSDIENDQLTFQVVSGPTNGTLSGTAPNLVYTPTNGYIGTDSFTFVTHDGQLGSQSATVNINVRNSNRVPAAKNDTGKSIDGAPVVIPVLANDTDPDGDPLAVAAVTQPLNGTAVINADQTVTYTPAVGFVGQDTFTYTASDGRGGTATATVTVNCTINHAPRAVNDVLQTAVGTMIAFNVLANDSDQDGDPLSVTSVTQPASGSLTWGPDGAMTFTPATGFRGKLTFTYTISDGRGKSDTATVSINVK